MTLSISKQIRESFNLHALRRESKILTGRQWDKRNAIVDRCERARNKELKLFNERFDGRVNQEAKRLMDKQASKVRQHKPGFVQDDIFSRSALMTQAHSNIRNRHERRMAFIERFETRELETLLQQSKRINRSTGQAKDALSRAADRRSGRERRRNETDAPIAARQMRKQSMQ